MKRNSRRSLVGAAAETLGRDLRSVAEGFEEIHDDEIQGQMEEYVTGIREGVGGAVLELARKGLREDAEALLAPLLVGLTGPESDPLPACLEALGRLEDRDANVALVKRLARRPSADLLRDLRRLDPRVLGGAAREEFGTILERLWGEAETEEEEEGIVALAFEALGKLRGEGVEMDTLRLRDSISDALAPYLESPVELERQRARVERIDELRTVRLLSKEDAADLLLGDALANIESAAPVAGDDEIADLVAEELAAGSDAASTRRLEELEVPLEGTTWLESHPPVQELAQIRVWAALGRAESPLELEGSRGMIEMAEAYGEDFAPGVALWLDAFSPEPGDARQVLDPYLPRPFKGELADAVSRYVAGLVPIGRAELLTGILGDPFKRRPAVAVLRQLGIEDAEEAAICRRIVELYESATRMEDRRQVLLIWEAFAPSGTEHRRRLIDTIFIPLARDTAGGYELARRHLELVQRPPPEIQKRLLETLRNHPDRGRRRKMGKRMKELGIEG